MVEGHRESQGAGCIGVVVVAEVGAVVVEDSWIEAVVVVEDSWIEAVGTVVVEDSWIEAVGTVVVDSWIVVEIVEVELVIVWLLHHIRLGC